MTGIDLEWDEVERLAAPRCYGILDMPFDPAFDDLVQIAAHVCQAQVALVSLVDADRHWFAAEIGLGVRQISLDQSMCVEALRGADVLVVPDLSQDRRFDRNPLVTHGPELRFYAGAVLKAPEGLPLGTICVLDDKPRPGGLTERQVFTLEALAKQVMAQLELRRSLRQRTEAWAAKDAASRQMNALLAEKDLLMQEVHHRMKNSLATVQALLLLQAKAIALPEIAQQLLEAAGRVHTFGGMHEHLYRTGAASHVNVAAYLQALVDDQQAAFASTLESRTITLEADSAPWPSFGAPTLGLIVVELVTNALKYGKGAVKVTFRIGDGERLLTVEDEGEDLPADFAPSQSKGFGMRLVDRLLQGQTSRELEIDRTRGHTCFRVRLDAPPLSEMAHAAPRTAVA
jgi:two-component sensor histidine kinase